MAIDKDAAREALQVGDWFDFANLAQPVEHAWTVFPEVQVAVEAAATSARSAIAMAYSMNSLRKSAGGKRVSGKFTAEAQDCLRAALLFAGAGLDTGLKRLAAHTLPRLVETDPSVAKRLAEYTETQISDPTAGGVSAKELVRLLLSTGDTPRDTMVKRWVLHLESKSAQSAQRVEEIAAALGVTDSALRARIKPTKNRSSTLESAFDARNQIAHELDVTKPEEASRKRLESIRRYRSVDEIVGHCHEILDVTQRIVNDVVPRAAA